MNSHGLLETLIGKAVLDGRYRLAEEFDVATPFRHLIIDGFFNDEFCERLLGEFPPFDESRAKNEFGQIGSKSTHENVRSLGPAYRSVDDLFKSVDFLELISTLTKVDDPIYDPEYFGGGTHDNRGGQDLDPHVDFNYHPKTALHRRLNLIIYLNKEWEESWGGSIELHSDPWSKDDESFSYMPHFNRAILFETNEYSWHGFKRIVPPLGRTDISRRSLTVYYYSLSRPTNEVAPPHTTFYVQRRLPGRFAAGYVLESDDEPVLHDLVNRRDHWIRFYQHRELEFGQQIERLREQLATRHDNPQLRPVGTPVEPGLPEMWLTLGRRIFLNPRSERLRKVVGESRRRLRRRHGGTSSL